MPRGVLSALVLHLPIHGYTPLLERVRRGILSHHTQNGAQVYRVQEVDNKLCVTSDDAGNDQLRAFREVALT